MHNFKKLWPLMLIVFLASLSSLALADHNRNGRHDGRYDGNHWDRADRTYGTDRPALTDEQIATRDQLFEDHKSKVSVLINDLTDQRLLYHALSQNTSSKPEEIKAIVSEMRRLREAIQAQNEIFKEALKAQGLGGYDGHFGRGPFHRGFGEGYDDGGPGFDCRKSGFGRHVRSDRFDRFDGYDDGYPGSRHKRGHKWD
ncbi:MAG: periplasmic heavy metal sensor [Deltaproteobacteria bacterium]|jgi:hypothetical protein|nr:periplasmic heavy metal sensor [Deltaproteobacteria bacterium]